MDEREMTVEDLLEEIEHKARDAADATDEVEGLITQLAEELGADGDPHGSMRTRLAAALGDDCRGVRELLGLFDNCQLGLLREERNRARGRGSHPDGDGDGDGDGDEEDED
jgi:hypothetical protein